MDDIGTADSTPMPPPLRRPTGMPLVQMIRGFLIVAAAACGAVSLLFFGSLGQGPHMVWSGLAFVVLGLALAACGWLSLGLLRTAATGLLALVVVVVAGSSLAMGWGLAAPGLPVMGLMVCALSAAAGWRHGTVLAAVAAGALAVVAVLSPVPFWGALTVPAQPPSPTAGAVVSAYSSGTVSSLLLLGTHLITLIVGLACGTMISQVMARYVAAARERELRFRRLLALAADAYWEIDHSYRLVSVSAQGTDLRRQFGAGALGKVPWELKSFGCASEALDELLADLDARQAFRDRAINWADREGQVRAFIVSGEPRFDNRGVFGGYWGVARDVTEVHSARAALEATESRYQELFSRIPTPLVLHQGHRVLDANPAALAMFGHADLGSMMGSDLHAAYEGGDSRERARRRVEQLMAQPVGTALPVSDFKLRVAERLMAVRATGVRVDADAAPAVLTIFVDDTERLVTEEAVRRSEAMLAHLVATSPDLITLTDLATGRYAMVNQAFERVTGWTVAEAVGHTSIELGVWASAAARDKFVADATADGQVTDMPVQFVNKSGLSIPMLVSAARFVMDRRDYIVVNARDISDRERLRLEREAILTNVPIGIAVTRDKTFVLANPHFEKIFGWAPGSLVGQSTRAVWNSDDDFGDLGPRLGQALARGESVDIESPALRTDGSHFVAHVRGLAIDPERPAEGGTAWIVEDVTERRQSATALARARDDAEAASRAKSAFLANTSHELRTPLNGLIGLAGLARAADITEAQRRSYLDQIAESAQALSNIISDILDVSKIEAGKLLLDNAVFDLGELLQALQATYRPLAQAKGLTLNFDVGAAAQGPVQGDPVRVRQVLSNFLSNALKFTEHGGLGLTVRRDGERVRFEVRDSGAGISAEVQARLFTPFTQGDQSTTRRYGGTGLGLSISRDLATLMGGQVGVDSAPGRGSTFWADLPLPPSTATLATPLLGQGAHLRGTKVLMVEDNPVNMMIAVAMLERWGVQVEQAHDGGQAVTAVRQAAADGAPFDAVLMDVQMPVMSGHEATRLLRNGGKFGPADSGTAPNTLPIIALTAAALVSEREEALRAGMNDFLTKPIDPDRLHNTLLRWCGR